jgi:demethylmenaquinone methyltransferase/2-methoxy-6-polyprenyl-1,4-benzoquinol methylase
MMRDKKISKDQVSELLFDRISCVYDFANRVLSFGIDKYWRNSIIKLIPSEPEQTLVDLATGTADQILSLSKSPHIAKFYGFDLSTNMLLLGQKKILKKGLRKKTLLQVGNAMQVPVASNFCDLVTISFGIRNVVDPLKCLNEMNRILKDDGTAYILEFSKPKSKFIRSLYFFYLRKILPRLGYLLSKNKEAYTYLNETIETFPSGEAFLNLMKSAGFISLRKHPLTFGIATIYVGKKSSL